MILEYKLHLHPDGYTYHPPFVKAFGFYNSEDKTYLGIAFPENQREYYIPDTVLEFTIEEAVTRCLTTGVSREVGPGQNLNDDDMTQFIRDWISDELARVGVTDGN